MAQSLGELSTPLAPYADYCAHQHGEAIDIPDLGIEIVRTFVSVDREFRAWQRTGHAGAPTATGDDREGQEGLR